MWFHTLAAMQVVNIPNSMTVLPELLPMSIEMADRNLTGIMNYTNPGAISHNEVLELYKEYIDPDFCWKNFTIEEQAKVIKAPRSNNLLDTARLETEFPHVLNIRQSLITYVFEPAASNPEKVGWWCFTPAALILAICFSSFDYHH